MRPPILAIVMLGALWATGAPAAWQVRDAAIPAAGSGVVRGVVVTDTLQPLPVRRATVRLAGAGTTVRLVGTDDEGRFTFDQLPSGPVTISAAKAGYVTTFHGATRPGRGPGVPVAVTTGLVTDITIRMLPGAVITGVLTDLAGRPAPGITVIAVDTRTVPGEPPAPVRVSSDDRGIYRFFGLAPGNYVVAALPQVAATDARGAPSAAAVGAITEADVQRARSGTPPPAVSTRPGTMRPVGYAPVFYPGTTDVSAVGTVHVGSGEERAGVDLALRVVPLVRLDGTLTDASNAPVSSATVSLIPKRGDRPSPVDALTAIGALALPRAVLTGSSFAFAGVAPGQYTLVARTGSGARGAQPPDPGGTLWHISDVTIGEADHVGLAVQLQPGLTASGRLVVNGTTPVPDGTNFNLSLVATNPSTGVPSTYRATVKGPGFEVTGVAPGAYVFRIDPPPNAGRWTLRSAMANGRDLADRPFTLDSAASVSGIVVTVSDRAAQITGRLLDAAGQPVTRYAMVAFTLDRSLWLPVARRIRSARPATDGTFMFDGLPAGDYAVAAVHDIEEADIFDPDLLSQILPAAIRITLTDGQTVRQDYRVGG